MTPLFRGAMTCSVSVLLPVGVDRDLRQWGLEVVSPCLRHPDGVDGRGEPGLLTRSAGIGLRFGSVMPGAGGPILVRYARLRWREEPPARVVHVRCRHRAAMVVWAHGSGIRVRTKENEGSLG